MFGKFCLLIFALLCFMAALLDGNLVCVVFSAMAGVAAYGLHYGLTIPQDASWAARGKVRLASACMGLVMFVCPPLGVAALLLSVMCNGGR